MTRVTSRSEPLFQSVRVRLRFANTQIIRLSSGSLFANLKNTVRVRLRFDKNSVKSVYKTPVWVRFDFLVYFLIYLNVKRHIFLSLVRWSKLLYINFCLIPQYINDYDNEPKPVGYHWQSLAINTLSVNVHCFYTILHFACHTVNTVYVSLPHSFNVACHSVCI